MLIVETLGVIAMGGAFILSVRREPERACPRHCLNIAGKRSRLIGRVFFPLFLWIRPGRLGM